MRPWSRRRRRRAWPTASWRSGPRCRARAARATISPSALGLDPEERDLHNMLLGGGFGRKSKWDFAIEAALLTKAMDGAPVKVVWTREDDIQHGFYHTVTAERLEAGLDKDNKVVAWRHRSAAPSLFANFMPDPTISELHRARHGLCRHAVQRAECPARKRRGAVACARRLVPLGQQRGARLGDPVVHRRDRSRADARSQGHAARADRAGADRGGAEEGDDRVVELRRAA